MNPREAVLDIARSKVGELHGPGNTSEFSAWYWAQVPEHAGSSHDPDCAAFISWCYHTAGYPLPEMQHVGYSGAASAQLLLDYARGHDWVLPPEEEMLPGDILVYDWQLGAKGAGHADHAGFVESVGPLVTIEADTGKPLGVYRRPRLMTCIVAVVRIPDEVLRRPLGGPCWKQNPPVCPV